MTHTHCTHCGTELDGAIDTVALGVCATCQRAVEDLTFHRGRHARPTA